MNKLSIGYALAIIGFVTMIISRVMQGVNDEQSGPALAGALLGLVGLVGMFAGLLMAATAKGRSWAWGFMALLPLIGLIVVWKLEEKRG